ncbi:hypothetical protein [Streptomyces sp. cmx-4-9]|uniref:hypothetical protein n=1 Tax=Streptomyces sp. cmx-4-9 TaxID=2790941 RepID=UPI00397F81BF
MLAVLLLLPALLGAVLALGRYEEVLLGPRAEPESPRPATARPPGAAPAVRHTPHRARRRHAAPRPYAAGQRG